MLLSRRLSSLGVRSFLPEPYTCYVLLFFLFPYLLLVNYARLHCWRDPTSVFFRENKAYDLSYSRLRVDQGNAFIEQANQDMESPEMKASESPTMCVGFASIAREGVSYFPSAVGTVLAGLSAEERADVYLILFFAHTDPMQHPAYSEPWVHQVADKVLTYDEKDVDIDHIRDLETAEEKTFAREKGLFDYTYLLKACNAVNTPYIVILEDDVVALDGWYHRTIRALNAAEQQTVEMGKPKWLYLRLFYTEKFLGWNSEEWPNYLFYSLLSVVAILFTTLTIRRYQPRSRQFLPNQTVFAISFVCMPLLVILFFTAGRVSMLPIPEGVNEMPNFGCCSQGFVFPQNRIMDLVSWYESKRFGYVDMLTEEYADQNGEIRWALTPSVLQHIGSKSSKTNDISSPDHPRSVSEAIWNFAFEENDTDRLHREHEKEKGNMGYHQPIRNMGNTP